ncbi:MAG: hypothetical protein ACI8P7_000671 [Candidatus Azotimanducaceae bacterium]|jgi:hypothetical protein
MKNIYAKLSLIIVGLFSILSVSAQVEPIFFEDFEAGCGNNAIPTCMVQVGYLPPIDESTTFFVSSACPIAGTKSLTTARVYTNGACGGTISGGTGTSYCPCQYAQGTYDSIVVYFAAPIDLTNYENVKFKFKYSGGSEGGGYDFGRALYSTDLATWTAIGPQVDNTAGDADIDFSFLDGELAVYVGFYFISDGTVPGDPYTAIQIDNVLVEGECTLVNPTLTSNTGDFDYCTGSEITLISSAAADYKWYKDGVAIPAANAQNYTVSGPGDYHVEIPSQECNFKSLVESVVENQTPVKPDLKPDVSPIETCGSGSGVELSFTTDPSYQSIRWYNDATIIATSGTTYDATESGFYYVMVTSGDGCSNYSDTVEVGLYPNPTKPVITADGATSVCSGESVTLRSSYSVRNQWYKNTVAIDGANNDFIIITQAGSYTVEYTDANGCKSVSNPVNVVIGSKPGKPNVVGDTEVCENESITLFSSATASSYQWFKGASPLANDTNQTLEVFEAGDYVVRVINSSGCFTDSDPHSVSLLAAAKPIVTPNGTVALCEGETVILASSTADSYQWYDGSGSIPLATNQTYEVTVSGTYFVQVTRPSGCSPKSDTVFVDVAENPAKPAVLVDGSSEICDGESVRIITNFQSAYQWYKDGTAITNATNQDYFVTENGDYTVQVFNESGCSATSNPKTITVKPSPEDPIVRANGPTEICFGQSVELEITTAGDNYQWHRNGVLLNGAINTTYTASESGYYNVIVTNNNSCNKHSDSILVTVNVEDDVIASNDGNTDLCEGDTRVLSSNYENGNQWYEGGIALVGETNQELIVNTPGEYYTIVTEGSCTRESNHIILVQRAKPAQPSITPGDTSVCAGESVIFTAVSTESSFAWYKNGNLIFGENGPTYEATSTGTYQVGVANQYNCEALSEEVSLLVYFEEPLAITPDGDQVICANNPITLTSNSNVANQWFVDGDTIPGADQQTYTTNQPGFYHVEGGAGDCFDVSDSVLVTVLPVPDKPVVTSNGPTTFCYGDSVRLFTRDLFDAYLWIRNGLSLNDTDTSTRATSEGDYQVVVFNAEGCSDTSDIVEIRHFDRPIINQVIVRNNSCEGFENGGLTVNATGGTGQLFYGLDTVRNFQLDNVFNDLGPSRYGVIVIDQNGCSDTVPAEVGNNVEDLAVSVNIDQKVRCADETNGAFTAFGDGGQGNLEYQIEAASGGISPWGASGIFQNLPGDQYTVRVKDELGCEAEAMVNLINPDSIKIELEVEDITCNNFNDGIITTTATGGWGNYLYSKNNGATWHTTPFFENLSQGEYWILVKDGESCIVSSDTVTVNNPELLNIYDFDILNQVSCFGEQDAAITIYASGGTGELEYGLVEPITAYDISATVNSGAGVWDFVVKDENGCTDTLHDITISEPNETVVDVVINNNNQCYLGEEGEIEVFASGGTGGLEFAISTAPADYSTQTVYSGLPAGTYTINVRDGIGCIVTSEPVTIGEPTAFIVNVSVEQKIRCFGDVDGELLVTTQGGIGAKMYNIALEGELHDPNDFQTSNFFGPLVPGIYVIAVKDAIACLAYSDPVDLSEPELLVVTLVTENLTCFGTGDGRVSAVVAGGTPAYEYSLNGATLGGVSSFGDLNPGAYSVVVVDENGCQSKSETVIISQPNPLEVSLEVTQNISCSDEEDGQLTANATGGNGIYTFTLEGPGGPYVQEENPLFVGLASGTYYVIVEDQKGCTTTSFDLNFEAPLPLTVFEAKFDSVSCFGANDGRITVTGFGGTPPYVYSLDNENFQDTNVFEGLSGGTYRVFIKDSLECVSPSYKEELVEPGQLFIGVVIEQNISCNGEIDGHIRASISGGTPPFLFKLNEEGDWQTDPNFYGLEAGNYTISISDKNGCSETSEPSVIENAEPLSLIAQVSQEITCKGADDAIISVTGFGGTGIIIYTINGGSGTISNEFTGLAPGVYTVVATDEAGCSQTAPDLTITAANAMDAGASATDLTCYEGEDGTATISAAGGSAPIAYSIDGLNYQPQGKFDSLSVGTYTLYARDERGCVITVDVEANQPEPFAIQGFTVANTTAEGSGSVSILIANATNPLRFLWNNNDTTQNISGLTQGTYTVTVTDANGCEGTESFVVENKIGLDEAEIDNTFEVYPNPTSGSFNIKWASTNASDVNVSILNSLGEVVYLDVIQVLAGEMNITINNQNLPKGIYHIRVSNESVDQIQKLIIQ